MKPDNNDTHLSNPIADARWPRNLPLGASLLAFALTTGCGSGGGGAAGGKPEIALNEGSYTVDDFNYVDEKPIGYHPLGRDGFQVLAREELFMTFPTYDGTGRAFQMQEGPDASHAEVTGISSLFAGTELVVGAAAGQLDMDSDSELVVATLNVSISSVTLHRVERGLSGQYERTDLNTVPADGWSIADARVSLADVDGDMRDEIILVTRSVKFDQPGTRGRVQVFDDPEGGGGELLNFSREGLHENIYGLAIDTDGDGDKEIAVALSGDSTDGGRYALRLYNLQAGALAMYEVHGWRYLNTSSVFVSSRAVVGDFDSNGRDDLAWVGYQAGSTTRMNIKLCELVAGQWQEYATWSLVDTSPAPTFEAGNWAVTAFQPEIGRTDLAVAFPDAVAFPLVLDYSYSALHYERDLNEWSYELGNIDRYQSGQGIALTAIDVDADGSEEVQVGLLKYAGSSGTLDLGYIQHDGGVALEWQAPITLGGGPVGSSDTPVPVLAAGDFDSDGFVLQHTGMRSPRLADPIPLVVLSAPPTVAGISQNYDDTESSYSTGNTEGTKVGVSTTTAVTYSASVSVNLFGILGVEGRTSLEKAVERSNETTQQVTIVEGYRGSYDADVIIFQGTLYETYEYVITSASDPNAIGTFMTLDVPIDANTYKWSVDYYNSQVAPSDRIGPDVLTHTPGDFDSYPTRAELQDLMAGEMHWDLPGSRPVGQSGASDFQTVSFATEQASEENRTVQKSYGAGVSFGIGPVGVSAGIDFTNTKGSTHGVFFATETVFEASMGDISDVSDHEAWKYNWGFSIQTIGKLADDQNDAAGYSDRKHSFQYLRYWAEPTGSAH